MVNQWLMIEGHSIGIGDTIADAGTYKDRVYKTNQEHPSGCLNEHVNQHLFGNMFGYLISVRPVSIIGNTL